MAAARVSSRPVSARRPTSHNPVVLEFLRLLTRVEKPFLQHQAREAAKRTVGSQPRAVELRGAGGVCVAAVAARNKAKIQRLRGALLAFSGGATACAGGACSSLAGPTIT